MACQNKAVAKGPPVTQGTFRLSALLFLSIHGEFYDCRHSTQSLIDERDITITCEIKLHKS